MQNLRHQPGPRGAARTTGHGAAAVGARTTVSAQIAQLAAERGVPGAPRERRRARARGLAAGSAAPGSRRRRPGRGRRSSVDGSALIAGASGVPLIVVARWHRGSAQRRARSCGRWMPPAPTASCGSRGTRRALGRRGGEGVGRGGGPRAHRRGREHRAGARDR